MTLLVAMWLKSSAEEVQVKVVFQLPCLLLLFRMSQSWVYLRKLLRRLAGRKMFGLNGKAYGSDQPRLLLSAVLSSPNISRPVILCKQLAAVFLRPVFCLSHKLVAVL